MQNQGECFSCPTQTLFWTARGSRVVVHNGGVRLVEPGSQVRLSRGQADGITNTLAQRPCTPARPSATALRALSWSSEAHPRAAGRLQVPHKIPIYWLGSPPVVTSTPGVSKFSGWPGVLEPNCRNCFKSSICTLS